MGGHLARHGFALPYVLLRLYEGIGLLAATPPLYASSANLLSLNP